jgi:hypothetical protein
MWDVVMGGAHDLPSSALGHMILRGSTVGDASPISEVRRVILYMSSNMLSHLIRRYLCTTSSPLT